MYRQMEGAVAVTRGIDNGCDYATTISCRKTCQGLFSDRGRGLCLLMGYFMYGENTRIRSTSK
jgi:hypothetical protein